MLTINGNAITLTCGDSCTLEVQPVKDKEPFTPGENDVIRFALSNVWKGEPGYVRIITKTVDPETMCFTLTAQETAALAIRAYRYDVELQYSDGNVDTFISGTFTITGEA